MGSGDYFASLCLRDLYFLLIDFLNYFKNFCLFGSQILILAVFLMPDNPHLFVYIYQWRTKELNRDSEFMVGNSEFYYRWLAGPCSWENPDVNNSSVFSTGSIRTPREESFHLLSTGQSLSCIILKWKRVGWRGGICLSI